MRQRLVSLLTIGVLLASAGGASAQEDGVTIDPDAPSSKEYAIPLENARRQADPNTPADQRVEQGTRSSPLFGEGIERQESGDAPATKRPARSKRRAGSSATPEPAVSIPEVVRVAATRPAAPQSDSGSLFLLGGGALALLAGGGAVALALRRRGA